MPVTGIEISELPSKDVAVEVTPVPTDIFLAVCNFEAETAFSVFPNLLESLSIIELIVFIQFNSVVEVCNLFIAIEVSSL